MSCLTYALNAAQDNKYVYPRNYYARNSARGVQHLLLFRVSYLLDQVIGVVVFQ